MLSLTIFAAAASAATQPAPATVSFPAGLPIAGQADHAAEPANQERQRSPTVWRFTDPGIDGGQVWL